MDSLSQALWQYALEERKLEEQRLQRVQHRMQLEEQRLQREQQLEMQRIQLEQQYEDQCRQSEFEEGSGDRSLFMIGDRSLFLPVPKPRTGIKANIGKKETQLENVVIDRCCFVPVPKPRTSIQPGDGKKRPSLEILCLRNTVLGLPVSILTVKVKGQFRHRDLLRDGAICVIHRHI